MSYSDIMNKATDVRDAAVAAYERERDMIADSDVYSNSSARTSYNLADHPCPVTADPLDFCAIQSIPDEFEWLATKFVGGFDGTTNTLWSAANILNQKAMESMGANETKLWTIRNDHSGFFDGATATAFGQKLSEAHGAANVQLASVECLIEAADGMKEILEHTKTNLETVADKTIEVLNSHCGGSVFGGPDGALTLLGIVVSATGGPSGIASAAIELLKVTADESEAGSISGDWVDGIIASMSSAITGIRDELTSKERDVGEYLSRRIAYLESNPMEMRVEPIKG